MRLSTLSCLGIPSSPPSSHRHRPGAAHWKMLVLAIGALLTATAAGADEAVFVVADGATSFSIDAADLVAAVPGASGPILATTPTGRGNLLDAGGVYQYQPSAEFFDLGSDSFHFEVASSDSSIWATAFLVAGMRGNGAFALPADDPSKMMASVNVHGGYRVHPNLDKPINGAFDLLIDIEPGMSLFIEPKDGDEGENGGSMGGYIECGGSSASMPGAEMVIAVAIDAAAQELARVLVIDGAAGPEIVGEIRSDAVGGFTRTKSMTLAPGEGWQVQWWGTTATGSRDAGLMLLADGAVRQALTGLDSPDLTLADWRFGSVTNSGFIGSIQLDDLVAEGALTIPRMQPVFADNFEAAAPVWSEESCEGGPLPTAIDGALMFPVDSAANCFRSRFFAEPQLQHRVRFTVNLEGAVLAPLDTISLLQGWQAGATAAHLEVQARRTANGTLQMSASAKLDGRARATLSWVDVDDQGERLVEVHQWTAVDGGIDGGLRLTVDDVLIGEALGLANGTRIVDTTLLGAMDVPEGNFGQVAFGVVEAWR